MDISPNIWFIVAALADFTGVLVHGAIGHRLMLTPLTHKHLFSTRAFGDEDMSWRIFAVTWHVVTAAFACSAVALLLLAAGVLAGDALPLFISALHATFLVVGVALMGPKVLAAFRRPIPITFGVCMTTACVASLLAMA